MESFGLAELSFDEPQCESLLSFSSFYLDSLFVRACHMPVMYIFPSIEKRLGAHFRQ